MQHRYNPDIDESHWGTTWSLDYCFMTADDEEEDMRAILAAYDHSKGADDNAPNGTVDTPG